MICLAFVTFDSVWIAWMIWFLMAADSVAEVKVLSELEEEEEEEEAGEVDVDEEVNGFDSEENIVIKLWHYRPQGRDCGGG